MKLRDVAERLLRTESSTETSLTHSGSLSMAVFVTSKRSRSGLKAIRIFSAVNLLERTDAPLKTAYSDVSRCCPSTTSRFGDALLVVGADRRRAHVGRCLPEEEVAGRVAPVERVEEVADLRPVPHERPLELGQTDLAGLDLSEQRADRERDGRELRGHRIGRSRGSRSFPEGRLVWLHTLSMMSAAGAGSRTSPKDHQTVSAAPQWRGSSFRRLLA